jgi:hypothetical protein
MPKPKRKYNCNPDQEQMRGSCFDCDNANYICEGDFLCDIDDTVVIADWVPTEHYCKCGGKHYEPV